MLHPDTQLLIERWRAMARAAASQGAVPSRDDLRAEVFGARLPRTFLLDVRAAEPIFRIAGSWIEALQERSLAGSSFAELWIRGWPDVVKPALARAASEARPFIIVAQVDPADAPAQVTVAPLRSRTGRADLILGMVASAAAPPVSGGAACRLSARLSMGVGRVHSPDPATATATAASGPRRSGANSAHSGWRKP